MLPVKRIGALNIRLSHCPSILVHRRFARVHDIRFLATHQPDRITEKYRHKLQQKAQELGLSNVDELKAVHKERNKPSQSQSAPAKTSPETQQHKPSSPFPTPPPAPQPIQSPSSQVQQQKQPSKPSPPGIKTLSSFIDIPKTLTLPPLEIEYIWRLRHAQSPQSLCAVIPLQTYSRIASTARLHPQFILPLPREGQGAEIHFLQWTFPTPDTATVLFTHLAEFKLRGEYAQPHTVVTHHLEIAEEKGVVLLEGSVMEGRGVSIEEGKWLLMCLQKFYGGVEEKAERKKLLRQFTEGDGGFKVEELLEEAEKIV